MPLSKSPDVFVETNSRYRDERLLVRWHTPGGYELRPVKIVQIAVDVTDGSAEAVEALEFLD